MADAKAPLALIIDDEEDLRQLARLALRVDGWRVETAANGKEGFELARKIKPDLILVDLMMPSMSGTEFCRRLIEDLQMWNIPVLMVSGVNARAKIVDDFWNLPLLTRNFLPKPFDITELTRVINELTPPGSRGIRRTDPKPTSPLPRPGAMEDMEEEIRVQTPPKPRKPLPPEKPKPQAAAPDIQPARPASKPVDHDAASAPTPPPWLKALQSTDLPTSDASPPPPPPPQPPSSPIETIPPRKSAGEPAKPGPTPLPTIPSSPIEPLRPAAKAPASEPVIPRPPAPKVPEPFTPRQTPLAPYETKYPPPRPISGEASIPSPGPQPPEPIPAPIEAKAPLASRPLRPASAAPASPMTPPATPAPSTPSQFRPSPATPLGQPTSPAASTPAPPPAAPAPIVPEDSPDKGYRILMIDDDEDIRMILQMGLGRRWTVMPACNGMDALEKMDEFQPDFVLSDMNMPVMNGLETAEAIRRHPRFGELPIFFLTAETDANLPKKAFEIGANLFLRKPVDVARVSKCIEYFLKEAGIQPGKYLAQHQREMEEKSAGPAQSGIPRIIVADFNIENHRLLKKLLGDQGKPGTIPGSPFETFWIEDPRTALGNLKHWEPDLILYNPRNPNLDGIAFGQTLKLNKEFAKTNVALMGTRFYDADIRYSEQTFKRPVINMDAPEAEVARLIGEAIDSVRARLRPKQLPWQQLHAEEVERLRAMQQSDSKKARERDDLRKRYKSVQDFIDRQIT